MLACSGDAKEVVTMKLREQAHGLQWLIAVTAIPLLAACETSVEVPKPPPKRKCISADECWDIKPSLNKACGWSAESDGDVDGGRFGRISPDVADRQFKIYDMHATKDLLVTIKTTVETQLPQPPQETYVPLLLRAIPKGSEMGGRPDRIDRGGPDRFLGCEWVRSGDLIQRYRFEVVKACFVDDPSCTTSPPYTKPDVRPPVDEELARCENACSGADKSACFNYQELVGPPAWELFNIYQSLTRSPVPFSVDVSPLLAAIGSAAGSTCEPRNLEVSASNDAVAFGPYCRLPLATPIGTPQYLQSVVLDAPNVVSGAFSRATTGPLAIAKIQFRESNTFNIEFYPLGSNSVSDVDPIVAAYFSIGRLMLAGKRKFCAVVPYRGG